MKNSIFTVISCHYSDVPKRLNYETGGEGMNSNNVLQKVRMMVFGFLMLFTLNFISNFRLSA